VTTVADEVLVIQPAEIGGVLPYPYRIAKDGSVGRQDFWRGTPTQLIGFVHDRDTIGEVDLEFDQFWADGNDAVDMFPVFAHADGTFNTYGHRRIASVRSEVVEHTHNPCCSSHGVDMTCERYRATHFVEVRPCCSADAARLTADEAVPRG
jgi:hypothetical protein